MKGKRILICVLVILAILVGVCFAFPQLPLRVYPGDRIKGTVALTIDGQAHALTADSFTRVNEEVTVQPVNDTTAQIAMRAGDYGLYAVNLNSAFADRSISIGCFQHNWWNVLRFDLQIAIDTKEGTITYSGHCTLFGDNGRRMTEPIAQKQPVTDEYYQIQFGL